MEHRSLRLGKFFVINGVTLLMDAYFAMRHGQAIKGALNRPWETYIRVGNFAKDLSFILIFFGVICMFVWRLGTAKLKRFVLYLGTLFLLFNFFFNFLWLWPLNMQASHPYYSLPFLVLWASASFLSSFITTSMFILFKGELPKRMELPMHIYTESTKMVEDSYEQLLYVYTNIIGGGKRLLEYKIKSLMKQGLSREEAINKLAIKERIIKG